MSKDFLFKTNDGWSIFTGEEYYWLTDSNLEIKGPCTVSNANSRLYPEVITFKHRESAEKYIKNKSKPEDSINQTFFENAYKSLLEMQIEKDKKYANSALKPLKIFSKHHTYGSRIDEKLARVKTSDTLRKNDVADIIGGLMLLCLDRGWDNFDDLID